MQQNKVSISSVSNSPSVDSVGLLHDVMNSMEQGIIVWNADGICELVNVRVYEVLELQKDDLYLGLARIDFLKAASKRGEFSEQVIDQAQAAFKEAEPFSFERIMPSGKVIVTSARPRDCGGFVVTFSDISELKESEFNIQEACNRAEAAEHELGKQLQNITTENASLERQQRELARLSMVATHAKDIIAITNSTGDVEWVNTAFTTALGYELEDIKERPYLDIITGEDTDSDSCDKLRYSLQNRQVGKVELQCSGQKDQSFWLELEVTPVFSENGSHTHFVAVGRDTTVRKAANQNAENARDYEHRKTKEAKLLAEFNEWLHSSDSLSELFPVVSAFMQRLLPSSSGAVYVYANSRDVLDGVCNWNDGKMVSNFEPSDCWALRRGRNYLYGENTVDFPCNHLAESHKLIPQLHYCLPIIAHGDTVGLLCIELPGGGDAQTTKDIRELCSFCAEQISLAIANVQLRVQLTEQSTRDPLTLLYNRRYFIECMRREISRCGEQGQASLISFDVDNFKKFNDNFGHDAGDSMLRKVSEVLLEMFSSTDVTCRYGGEEFAIFLPGASTKVALQCAEKLRLAVQDTVVRYNGEELVTTISVGVATYPANGTTVQGLIKNADKALYTSKNKGRNNTHHCNDIDLDT